MIMPEKNEKLLRVQAARAKQADASAANEDAMRPRIAEPDSEEWRPVMAAIKGDARSGLSFEHVAEIRQRIRDGAYNTVEIADQVAQRLLSSGDLESDDQ